MSGGGVQGVARAQGAAAQQLDVHTHVAVAEVLDQGLRHTQVTRTGGGVDVGGRAAPGALHRHAAPPNG